MEAGGLEALATWSKTGAGVSHQTPLPLHHVVSRGIITNSLVNPSLSLQLPPNSIKFAAMHHINLWQVQGGLTWLLAASHPLIAAPHPHYKLPSLEPPSSILAPLDTNPIRFESAQGANSTSYTSAFHVNCREHNQPHIIETIKWINLLDSKVHRTWYRTFCTILH